ncbi:MAG: DUF5056 domain-containing protein [Paludibacter sp.]|nr:DUF5056 domain-containing protein [Paludibacter sp.]
MKQKFDDNDLMMIFRNHKNEISDEGFSKKVCEKLPSDSNFSATIYSIRIIMSMILITSILKYSNFTDSFCFFILHVSEKFASNLTLFFSSPKIYITTFVFFLIAGGFAMKKEMLF